ncbi:MAG: hypothetical protein GY884_01845 [Proteobacteria bacterium]|nr:hypothetical protein [Pseudomonadota bacterium]
MDGRFPGQSLVDRLEKRKSRRPHVGLSPAFYARFGLEDPWLDTGGAQDEGQVEEMFSYVSARPWQLQMRRLAMARWRRARRERQSRLRTIGERTRAVRRFPGETVAKNFAWGVPTLGTSDFVTPVAWEGPAGGAAQQQTDAPSAWGTANGSAVRVRTGADAWITHSSSPARVAERRERGEYVPAETFRTPRRERAVARTQPGDRALASLRQDRPTDRVGRRLQQAAVGRDPLRKALADVGPTLDSVTRRKVARALVVTEHLDERTRVVEIRRILRHVASAKVVRTVLGEAPQADVGARPIEVANGRGAPKAKRRGLRPVLSSSPSMEVVEHEAPQAAEVAAPKKASSVNHAGARVIRSQKVQPQLSTSPVVRTKPTRTQLPALSASPVSHATASTTRVHRTPDGVYRRATAMRTASQRPTANSTIRTGARQDTGARSATGDYAATRASGTHRTVAGDLASSAAFRTAASTTTGARSGTTPASAHAASRAMRTVSTDWETVARFTTDSGEFVGADAFRTAGRATPGASLHRTAAGETAASDTHRTATSDRIGARAVRTATGAFVGSTGHRTADGEFLGARTSTWAADRLSTTGRADGKRSLMPRIAPRVDVDSVVQPIVVHTDEEVAAAVKAAKAKNPNVIVKVTEKAAAWNTRDHARARSFTASRSALHAAAERAVKSPTIGDTATRASTSAWASPNAPVELATTKRAARRIRGPVSYASTSVAHDATVVQHAEAVTAEAATSQSPSGWAPSKVVKTPSRETSRSQTHRTASRPHSAADWSPSASAPTSSTARRMRTAHRGFDPTGTWRTDSGDWVGASTHQTGDSRFEAARRGSTRPIDWVGARVAVGSTDAYRGAFARTFRTRQAHGAGAGVWQTAKTPFVGARRGSGLVRPDLITPEYDRAELGETLMEQQRGVPVRGAAGWAERAVVPDRLRGTSDLVAVLVHATDPAEVIEIILDRGSDLKMSSLPRPVIQVIEQIRTEAHKADAPGRSSTSASAGGSTTRTDTTRRGNRRSSARILNGWTGLAPSASAQTTGAVGDDKVSKLAKKLRGLIHLAQNARMGDALREARLAHADRPDARMQEGGDISNAESSAMANFDIEALGREVLEVVVRELELRQERRQEDSDGNIWW